MVLVQDQIFLHLYQICSANKWYRHQSTWDAPSLSHQSIPLVNRWSRLVVYLLKACSQWVSENTEANPPVPIIKFGCIHKHPSQKTHQGLAQCTVAGILGVFAGLDLGGQSYQTYEVVGAIWSSEWMLNADVLCWLWLCSVTMFYFMIFMMCAYCTMYVYIYIHTFYYILFELIQNDVFCSVWSPLHVSSCVWYTPNLPTFERWPLMRIHESIQSMESYLWVNNYWPWVIWFSSWCEPMNYIISSDVDGNLAWTSNIDTNSPVVWQAQQPILFGNTISPWKWIKSNPRWIQGMEWQQFQRRWYAVLCIGEQ